MFLFCLIFGPADFFTKGNITIVYFYASGYNVNAFCEKSPDKYIVVGGDM